MGAEQLSAHMKYQHLQCFKYIPISNSYQSVANADIHSGRIISPTEQRFIDVGLKKTIVQSLFSFHFISTQTIFKPHSIPIQSPFNFHLISIQSPFKPYLVSSLSLPKPHSCSNEFPFNTYSNPT